MKITVNTVDNISVISIEGVIDGKTAPEAQTQVLSLLQPKSKLILDMRNVNYISSAGLRVLLLLYRQSKSQSSRFALVGLADEVKDVMKITDFLQFFDVFDTVEAAKTALL